MNSRAQTILDYAIVSMIAGMILSTVSSQKIPSLLFYVLIAASCLNWYVHYRKGTSTEGIELKQHKTLFILCSVSLIAVLVSKAVHLDMSGTEIEKAVRFSIGLPLLYAGLRFISYERLKHALWGVYAAIIFQFIYSLYMAGPSFARPYTAAIHNAVSYGVIVLLLSVICFFSLKVNLSKNNKLELVFKWGIVCLGIVTFILLQTRTGVLALPVIAFLITAVFFYNVPLIKKIVVLLISLVIILGGVLSIPTMKERFNIAKNEYHTCVDRDFSFDSSICIRMQLYRAAWHIWQEEPLFGTGDNSVFQHKMKDELQPAGIVSSYTANEFGEPHNDYMQNLSSFGILGVVGILFLYLAPGYYFFRRVVSCTKLPQRCVAAMGAATCLSFSIFSLTELIFRNMRMVSFYTTLVVLFIVLLNLACGKRREYTD